MMSLASNLHLLQHFTNHDITIELKDLLCESVQGQGPKDRSKCTRENGKTLPGNRLKNDSPSRPSKSGMGSEKSSGILGLSLCYGL